MKTYGIGVLGCGAVSQHHMVAYENSERLKCVCVYDPAQERALDASRRIGARVAESAEEVLTASDVEIVAVLSPVFTHADYVEVGAAAGKHFMLEKPMATTSDDGERIVNAIEKAGVKCFHPTLRALASDLFEKLQELTADDGQLGPVSSAFYHLVGKPFNPSSWMLDRKLCFPPGEYDPHVFDTFLELTGDDPATVWCHTGRYSRSFEQDDVTIIAVTFHGGRFLQFDVHWVLDPEWKGGTRAAFDIVCERGLIRHNWWSLEWHTADGVGEFASKRRGTEHITQGNRWDHYHALIDAIENGSVLSPNELDGLRYVRIQDAAVESSQTGQIVTLDRDS